MKRITSLLILCVAAIMAFTANAQENLQGKAITAVGTSVPLLADLNTNNYYVLYNTGRGWYIQENEDATACKTARPTTLVGLQNEDLKILVKFELAGTGRGRDYRIKTVSGKYFNSPTNDNEVITLTEDKETAGFFEIKTTGSNGYFYLRGMKNTEDTSGKNLEGDEDLVIGWGANAPTGTHGNGIYTFTPVTVEETQFKDVTIKYNIGERTYTTTTAFLRTGQNFTVPQIPFITINSYEYQGQGLPEGVTELNVDCSEALPFKASESLDNPVWQAVEVHWNQQPYKWRYDSDDVRISTPITSNTTTAIYDDNFFWAFTGNLIDGFKIHNKAAGNGKWLRKGEDGAQVSATDDSNVWFLTPTSAYADKTTNCCFHLEGDNQYLNHQGSGSGDTRVDYMGYWVDADNGSTCRFVAPAEPLMNAIRLQIGSSNAPLGAVGTFKASREELQELITAYHTAEANTFDFNNAKALEQVYVTAPTELVDFVPGQYYRVINAGRLRDGKNTMMGFEMMDGTNTLQGLVPSQSDANFIWRINQYNERVRFINSNTGKFMSPIEGGATLVEEGGAGAFTMTAAGECKFKFTDTQGKVMHQAASGNHWKIIHWEDNCSYWYLMPAKELEISLLTAVDGKASYATAYLPFTVSGAEGAEIYTGTVSGEYVNLRKADDGVAANNAMVLVGEPNAQTATILLGEGTATSEGISGTCQPKTVAASSVLTLGRCSEYEYAGFYTFTGTTIPANKAYIEQTSGALKLNFGETTGIGNVNTDGQTENNEATYDLSGRRVTNIVKGGLYIRGGKKFIVR